MYIPVEILLDGVVDTLLARVLPHVQDRPARGQLYAAVDVLRNLRDRVEPKRALLEAEATSAGTALALAIERLREADANDAADRIALQLSSALSCPIEERVGALRTVLAAALAVLADVPEPAAEPARAALGAHLAAQAFREVSVLKPSMLAEISRG